MVVLSPLLVPMAALAAEVTDLPPRWRGDIHAGYSGDLEQAGLSEPVPAEGAVGEDRPAGSDRTFGIRNILAHDVGIRLEGSVWHGVAITLGFPITVQQRISYPSAREMLLEPTTGQGSYVNGQPITAPTITSGGLQGVWIGVAAAPLNQTRTPRFPVSTRFDLAVRTPMAKATLFSGNRGAGSGLAVRMAAAFSHEAGAGAPYLSIDYTHELSTKTDVLDNDGTAWARSLPIKAPNRLDLTAGVEAILRQVEGTSTRVAWDFHASFGYRSWSDVASGFYLPSTLDASRSIPVTTSEHLRFGGGSALDYHVNEWIGLRLGVDAAWITPHRVEHPYPVYTDAQSYDVGWKVELVGRVRKKGEPAVE